MAETLDDFYESDSPMIVAGKACYSRYNSLDNHWRNWDELSLSAQLLWIDVASATIKAHREALANVASETY